MANVNHVNFFNQLPKRVVKLGAGPISYREVGQGSTLLFVHGFLHTGLLWRKLLPRLSQKYRCVLPDLPLGAHTQPMSPHADLSMPGVANLVLSFMDELKLEQVALVGVDTGSGVCQIVAAKAPDRLAGMVLTSGDAYEVAPPMMFSYLKLLPYLPGGMWAASRLIQYEWFMRFPLGLGWLMKRPAIDILREVGKPCYQSSEIRQDMSKVIKGIHHSHTLEAAKTFRHFQKPVLIPWAEEDRIFPFKIGQRLAADFPRSKLVPIRDSYTFISEDQPEQLVDAMLPFLEEVFPHAN